MQANLSKKIGNRTITKKSNVCIAWYLMIARAQAVVCTRTTTQAFEIRTSTTKHTSAFWCNRQNWENKTKMKIATTTKNTHLHRIIPHNCVGASNCLHPHHHTTSIWSPHIPPPCTPVHLMQPTKRKMYAFVTYLGAFSLKNGKCMLLSRTSALLIWIFKKNRVLAPLGGFNLNIFIFFLNGFGPLVGP